MVSPTSEFQKKENYNMSETPSHRRRRGRMDFEPYVDPSDINPYSQSIKWGADMYSKDWLDGWKEAEDAWKEEQKQEANKIYCPHCGEEL